MFGILFSAINAAIGPLLTAVFIKAIIFTALSTLIVFIIAGLTAAGMFPSVSEVMLGLGGLPSMTVWTLQLFRFDLAVNLIFGAMATRFVIRRIPFFN